MAKWRALHSDISTSGQVDQLTEFEQLLFTWMIPHADDWGVITGDARELKLKVLPGSDRTCQEMTGALRHMEEVGLVWLYEPDDYGPLVQFRRWDTHQPIREDRRKDPEKPLHFEHAHYPDFPSLAWHCPAEPGTDRKIPPIQDNTILDKEDPPTETRKRDKRLDHWAIKCYQHVARKHVEIALRDRWITFAETQYAQGDDEQKFAAMETDLQDFIAKGWYKGNIAWFMDWVEQGKPEKWKGGARTRKKDHFARREGYYEDALRARGQHD
jgi:hypothetical protein